MARRAPSPLPLLAGLLAAYLVAPLLAGLLQSFSSRWSDVDVPTLLHACVVSVASATAATFLVALGGIPLGYLLARIPGRAMAVLGFLVQLPLALPPLASGVLLLFLVGYDTPLGRLTAGALTDSFVGIVLAEAFVAAPFVVIASRSAFSAIDPDLEGVAATLGRRPLEVFLRVSLPIARPALLSGLLLAWLRAFGEFGATVMVAYHPYSLPVYTYVAFGARGLPAMLPVLLPALLLAFAILALSSVLAPRATAGGVPPEAPRLLGATGAAQAPPPLWVAASPDLAVEAAGLTFSLEKRLDGFHLAVAWSPRSRRLALLGPSGSGKSLTLKLLAGTEEADRGRIEIGGRDVSACPAATRQIAYVPQSYGLFPNLTLLEQLCFPAGAAPEHAARWIERLGLQGLERRRPTALSLGQQQRVALARALLRPARLLLLDEPLSALDAPLRAALREELLQVQAGFPGTMILVTHDPGEARLLAEELLVLEGGRVLQAGRTEHVHQRPATAEVARLLGAEHAAEGTVLAGNVIAVGGGAVLQVAGPPLDVGQRVNWSIPTGRARLGRDGQYEGTVVGIVSSGLERRLTVRFGDARVRIPDDGGDWATGSVCRFDLDPRLIQVWSAD